MGLKLYLKQNDQFVEVSESGSFTNPIATQHNGKVGDSVSLQLYIRNDDPLLWYSNVIITPKDTNENNPYEDVAFVYTGWGVKLNDTTEEPSSAEWGFLDWGNSLNIGSIGNSLAADTTTYHPFWYMITCPPNEDAKIKTDIILNVSYTENSV